MNTAGIIVLVVVALCIIAAAVSLIRRGGSCGSPCDGCALKDSCGKRKNR
ncbi:MAG: hypothetical protein MJY42_04490 [Bacteroidales bacterium]|nr:hypothetical protein [Bacteroidales bacterium]